MTLNLKEPDVIELKPRIVVFGVGGAGGNAVSNMIKSNLEGVDFVVANTDAQALAQSQVLQKIQMGTSITEGLGAGSRPEIGGAAAEESMAEIMDSLTNTHMVFITAGMGGGTGTGAAPVIARAAREQGILTVGVVTKPFHFEGGRRMRTAERGIEELQSYVDTLIVIPNQNLFRIANEKTTFADAFKMADEVLHSGVRGITDLMVMPGLINLDFADVRTIMNEMGKAMMGTGEAEGDTRAIEAAEAAINNPLLDEVCMKGARGVLINITGGMDMTLFEVDEAANRVRSEVDPDANIIVGSTFNEDLDGKVRVSIVATGIDGEHVGEELAPPVSARPQRQMPQAQAPAPQPAPRPRAETETWRPTLSAPPAAEKEAVKPAPAPLSQTPPAPAPKPSVPPVKRPIPASPAAAELSADDDSALRIVPMASGPAPQLLGGSGRENGLLDGDLPPAQPPAEEDAPKRTGGSLIDRMAQASGPLRRSYAENRAALRNDEPSEPAEEPKQRDRLPPLRATPNDQLFPNADEKDQLEIPAFLRRQAN